MSMSVLMMAHLLYESLGWESHLKLHMLSNGVFRFHHVSKGIKKDEICSVCHEALTLGVVRLPCKHKFHERCITQWIACGHNTCPLCRKCF